MEKTESMETILSYLQAHHHSCDQSLAEVESLVSDGKWDLAQTAIGRFMEQTELHFQAEERILFPSFEGRRGSTEGPTMVMKYEHEMIRNLFDQMKKEFMNKDKQNFLKQSESCHLLIQQHNMKEEQILYPMCDQMLESEVPELILNINRVIKGK